LSPTVYLVLSLIAVFVVLPVAIFGLFVLERVTTVHGVNNFGLTELLGAVCNALGINS
jgi:hypothetical protein